MLAFKELTINFDSTRGIIQREHATAVFSTTVNKAEAVLKGFRIGYTDGDHPVWQQEIDLDAVINGRSVTVYSDFLIRDNTGHIDDAFKGWVQCVVIADVA